MFDIFQVDSQSHGKPQPHPASVDASEYDEMEQPNQSLNGDQELHELSPEPVYALPPEPEYAHHNEHQHDAMLSAHSDHHGPSDSKATTHKQHVDGGRKKPKQAPSGKKEGPKIKPKKNGSYKPTKRNPRGVQKPSKRGVNAAVRAIKSAKSAKSGVKSPAGKNQHRRQ